MRFLEPTEIDGMERSYRRYPGPYAIDEKDLEKIFPDIKSTKTTEVGEWRMGNLETHNLKFINSLVAYLKPAVILEIGTFRGRTTYNMSLNSPQSEIITIDFPNGGSVYSGNDTKFFLEKENIGKAFKGKKRNITQIYQDSSSVQCLYDLEHALKGRKIDFAFIDGGHTYDNVKNDFEELVLPRLRRGGIAVFDDYNRPYTVVGVSHYLMDKAYKQGYVFYWYAPRFSPNTNEVIFLNRKEAKGWVSQ